jgi:hypothetical protein
MTEQINGLSYFMGLTVAFTDASSVGALLGQADFFPTLQDHIRAI